VDNCLEQLLFGGFKYYSTFNFADGQSMKVLQLAPYSSLVLCKEYEL